MKSKLRLLPLFLVPGLLACGGAARQTSPVQSGLEDYLRQARSLADENNEVAGSLWTTTSSLSSGFTDVKARNTADIVIIQVIESTSAVSEATTQTTKDSTLQGSATNFFGAEKKLAELAGLVDTSRSEAFSGDGSTTRRSVLTTNVTARVVEVFPNGLLLLEGNRELMINGERQIVTVRGVVRPEDISPQNVVPSTSVAELEVAVEGRGVVSRAQEPGAIYKILSGFWPF